MSRGFLGSVQLRAHNLLKTKKRKRGEGGETGTGSQHEGGTKGHFILDRGKQTKYRLIYLQVHR